MGQCEFQDKRYEANRSEAQLLQAECATVQKVPVQSQKGQSMVLVQKITSQRVKVQNFKGQTDQSPNSLSPKTDRPKQDAVQKVGAKKAIEPCPDRPKSDEAANYAGTTKWAQLDLQSIQHRDYVGHLSILHTNNAFLVISDLMASFRIFFRSFGNISKRITLVAYPRMISSSWTMRFLSSIYWKKLIEIIIKNCFSAIMIY